MPLLLVVTAVKQPAFYGTLAVRLVAHCQHAGRKAEVFPLAPAILVPPALVVGARIGLDSKFYNTLIMGVS